MNIATLVVLLLIVSAVVFIVRKMIRDKKNGKTCSGCSGSCSGCSGSCASHSDLK